MWNFYWICKLKITLQQIKYTIIVLIKNEQVWIKLIQNKLVLTRTRIDDTQNWFEKTKEAYQ